jgi:glyoxylase-like metal-dependent hydrolase (beta-lactamase superfamily II)
MMKEILTDVYSWSWFSEDKAIDFNGFFVRGVGGAVVVDPPRYRKVDLQHMEQLGAPQAIVITNRHHARESRTLAAHFGIPIRIQEADAPLVEPPLGGIFKEGDALGAGLKAIGVPHSKSPGETALHVPWANALIVGDALIGKPAGSLSLLPPSKFKDPRKAREGLRCLLDIPFESILVGDGTSILRRGKEALREFLSRQVLD